MEATTLNFKQAAARLGISYSLFMRLLKSGTFDRCMSPLPRRLSTVKLDAWAATQSLNSRPWKATA